MSLLSKSDLDELLPEPGVVKLLAHLQEQRDRALKRLRLVARAGSLEEVRQAEQRVLDMEEFLGYFDPDE